MPHPVSTSSSGSSHPPERPATFREVLAIGEYRALFSATALSWLGDYMAKIAVTVLVFERTGNAGAAAAAFAISYAPWLLIGPVLTALAERLPRRRVMIASDLFRLVTIGLVASFEQLPIPVMIGLLFLTALGNPPYDAARNALTPTILPGDKLVVGTALIYSGGQAAQIVGYLVGGVVAAINPRLALGIDAATFALSALLIVLFIKSRPAVTQGERRHLLRETADGFGMVFGTPALRGIALLVFSVMAVAMVPEGLGVLWAEALNGTATQGGIAQGLIMIAPPVGFIVGGLVMSRAVKPETRRKLVRPLAVLPAVVLVPALLNPPLPAVLTIGFVSGFAVAGLLPTTNAMFVEALPITYRARAFGVMQSGMQLLQGGSVAIVGVLAHPASEVPRVIGLWGIAGFGVVLVVTVLLWPPQERFAAARERARAVNEAA